MRALTLSQLPAHVDLALETGQGAELYGSHGQPQALIVTSRRDNGDFVVTLKWLSSNQDEHIATSALQVIRDVASRECSSGEVIVNFSKDHTSLIRVLETTQLLYSERMVKDLTRFTVSMIKADGITTRNMTDEEANTLLRECEADLAATYTRHANGAFADPKAGCERARAIFEKSAPQGSATPGHKFTVYEETSTTGTVRRVGSTWTFLDPETKSCFAYYIVVDPSVRNQGYGKEITTIWEQMARQDGATALKLNVFSDNTPARALYARKGFLLESAAFRLSL